MDKRFLKDCLAKDMSLEAIGKQVGKHPSTVSYWLKKHGLTAAHHEKHAATGKIDPKRLKTLVDRGASIREIAIEVGAGYSTIRYWLQRLELCTHQGIRRRASEAAREAGLVRAQMMCPKHGATTFFIRTDGGYRCSRCNSAAVTNRRRLVKRQLVEEAGGRCRVCGFGAHESALQFHHLDPAEREFHLGYQGVSRSIARMRAEARKCVLLCANCHSMVEAGVLEVPIFDR